MEEDSRPILRSYVRPLAVPRGRIVQLPKVFNQSLVSDLRGIKRHLDNFGVTGTIGTDILVGRVLKSSAFVTDSGIHYSGNLAEGSLNAPKASGAKRSFFVRHSFSYSIRCC